MGTGFDVGMQDGAAISGRPGQKIDRNPPHIISVRSRYEVNKGLYVFYTEFYIKYIRTILAALFVLFSERVVNWNSLPVDTDFSSLARFIQQINSLDFSEFRYIKC